MEYYKGSPNSEGTPEDPKQFKKLKTSSQNGLALEEISTDGGEFEVTSKYTSLTDSFSTEIFSADEGDEVTNKEEPSRSDVAKDRISADEEVARETGVQLNDQSSSGIGNGTAKWVNTFDLNERPQDEDADENN